MPRSRSTLWILLTIIVGLITTLLVWNYLTGLKKKMAPEPMSTIVVAAKKIPHDTLLTPDMVKTVQIPTKYVHAMSITKMDNAVKQFAKQDIEPEEVILSSQLASEKTSQELVFKIPEGNRAITIATSPPNSVAGHVKPGDRVDILFIYDKDGDTVVSTVLQKILVLAVGAEVQKKEGVQPAENITLAVNPKDAQLIALTESTGKLKLDLRPAADENTPGLKSSNFKSLKEMYP